MSNNCPQGTNIPELQEEQCDGIYTSTSCITNPSAIPYLELPENSSVSAIIQNLILNQMYQDELIANLTTLVNTPSNLQTTTDGDGNNITTNDIKVKSLFLYDTEGEAYGQVVINGNSYFFKDVNGENIFSIFDSGDFNMRNANTGLTYTILGSDLITANRRMKLPDFEFFANGLSSMLSFANDTDAGLGGVAVGQFYHTAGVVKVRLT